MYFRSLCKAVLYLLGCVLLTFMASDIFADAETISYQGYLTDEYGDPVPDGILDITFLIYPVPVGGVHIWSETQAVQTTNGLFSVRLGSIVPLDLAALGTNNRFLEIQVNPDPPMVPRTRLTSVPKAATAQRLTGDVETGESSLILKNNSGDSLITMTSDAKLGGAMFRMKAGWPTDPIVMVEMQSNDAGGSVVLDNVEGKYLDFEPAPDNTGGNFSLYNPLGDPATPLAEISTSDGSTGFLVMREYNGSPDTDSSMLDFTGFSLYQEGNLRTLLDPNGLTVTALSCGTVKGGFTTTEVGGCGMAIIDTTGDTIMNADKDGVEVSESDRGGLVCGMSAAGFFLAAGASDGYVLTSNDSGLGTWAPATGGGSMPCGVAQGIDITDDDTLYNSTKKNFISQSIDCPAGGYVLVMGSCDALINHHLGVGNPRFMFGVTDTPGSMDGDQRKEWYLQDYSLEPGIYSCVIATQKIFPVSSGINTFYMAGYRSVTTGCTDSCWIDNKTLSLVFIPESYGTVETASSTGDEPDLEETILQKSIGLLRPEPVGEKERVARLEAQVEELTSKVNELLEKQK